jgi:hypothetical protein
MSRTLDRETGRERGRCGNTLLKNEQYLDASSYITVFTAKEKFLLENTFHYSGNFTILRYEYKLYTTIDSLCSANYLCACYGLTQDVI